MSQAVKTVDTGKFKSSIESNVNNKVTFTIHVSPEYFREGLNLVHKRNKGYFNIPGFRKGKAPRKIVEQYYGADVYHEEAVNYCLPDAYEHALDELSLEPVYKPDVSPGEMSEKEGAYFTISIETRPEVTVSEYVGLPYPKEDTEVSDGDIEKALKAEQEKNARRVSVDRAAQLGDVVTINFVGYIDGEPFEGGSGQDTDLSLGSGQFIPGFEEQLVDYKAGDDVKVNVTFPQEYLHKELAGKAAEFDVEILDVQKKELPELDDEFAETVSEFDTIDEYREYLKEKIREYKEANLKTHKRNYVLKKLIESCAMEVPESMYLARLDDMMDDFSMQVRMRGMDVENYMRFSDMTEESLKAGWRNQAERDVKSTLALYEVAKKENLTCSEEELKAKVAEVTLLEGDDLDRHMEKMPARQSRELKRSVLCNKALDFVLENAVPTEGLEDTEGIDFEEVLSEDLLMEE